MNQFRKYIVGAGICAVLFVFTVSGFAQTEVSPEAERSYDVTLQVLIGSGEAAQTAAIPSNLTAIAKQIKANFGLSSLYNVNTLFGRVSNSGTIDHKSVSANFWKGSEMESRAFLEWTLSNLRGVDSGFQAQSFRFGARIPLVTTRGSDEGNRSAPVVNYEAIGLNIAKIGVGKNVPTVVGTLSLPRTNDMLFLVLTVADSAR